MEIIFASCVPLFLSLFLKIFSWLHQGWSSYNYAQYSSNIRLTEINDHKKVHGYIAVKYVSLDQPFMCFVHRYFKYLIKIVTSLDGFYARSSLHKAKVTQAQPHPWWAFSVLISTYLLSKKAVIKMQITR